MNSYERKQAERRERLAERAERKQAEANARYKTARTMAEAIPFGQPILVGHYSEKRDRNYRKRIDGNFRKAFALNDEAAALRARANTVSTAISSDDPDAIDKLREKLAAAQKRQDMMKAANKAVRKGDVAELAKVVGSETAAAKLMEPDVMGTKGFASWELTNNSANIRRMQARIDQLELAAKREAVKIETNRYTLREDPDENRVMFIFPGKPSAEIRSILKTRGFRWSPSRMAWVRMLNNAGRWNAEAAAKAIDEAE